jgi:hypothetical protein
MDRRSHDGKASPRLPWAKWRFAKNPMTAGRLGKKFKNAVDESSDLAPPLTSRLKEAARTFLELAD